MYHNNNSSNIFFIFYFFYFKSYGRGRGSQNRKKLTRNFFLCPFGFCKKGPWERKGPFYFLTNNILLGIEKVFSMTEMVILLISRITFIIGNMKLLVLATKANAEILPF